jgi:glycosyltransferase involved in cell wall biosynthesis
MPYNLTGKVACRQLVRASQDIRVGQSGPGKNEVVFETGSEFLNYQAIMKVSVIIPAYNEAKLLGGALDSIRRAMASFAAQGWETELLVCDNNSTDRTPDIARAAGARVVFEPVNQIARARNTGAGAASGDWLLFIDADSYPSPELFADVAHEIQLGQCLGGGSTVHMNLPFIWGWVIMSGWNWISRLKKWAAGSFLFCEAAAFRRLGGFNQQFFASEEIDLSKRLQGEARRLQKRFVILHQHPLLTSDRKLHLYTPREYVWLLWQTVWHWGQNLRDRARCSLWYDGRR